MIYKNVANQKLAVFAYTSSTGAAKTGDAANITCYLSIDWGAAAAVTDTNPTELDASNMPGWYVFDLAQAETDGEVLVFAPKSATSGVVLEQVQVFTQDASISSRASQTSLDTVDSTVDAILADTGTDGVVLANDAITSAKIADDAIATEHIATGALTADSFAADSIAAAAVKADTVTKIQSGLATATALTTVDDLVDDLETRLTATRAGYLDNLSAGAVATATAVADLPTNAELDAALAAADDAVLAAIAALNDISTVEAQAAAAAALTAYSAAKTGDAMTLATDAVSAAALKADAVTEIQSGLSTLTAADVRTAIGLATANLDAQLAALPTASENADALLIRDWTAITGTVADRSTLNALRFLRNKWSISGTTLTVTEEDDTTAAWTGAVTTTSSTDGITALDPA